MQTNLRKLIEIGTQLCLESCAVVNECYHDKNLKKYMKKIDDPVTQADLKIQSMLINGFNHYFPNLKIIGQETQPYPGILDNNFQKIKNSFLPSYINMNEQVNIRSSCLWIDPLDCTRGFINGNVEDVTVLVGLSIGKEARLGIIGTPFKRYSDKIYYDPSIIIGSTGHQQAYQYRPLSFNKWSALSNTKISHKQFKVVTSNSRQNRKQDFLIHGLNGINIKAGGSGRKIVMVAKQQADLMVFIDSYTHKWDSCAGQAIIQAMGGYFTTPSGKQIIYDPTNRQTRNFEGLLCCLDKQKFFKAVQLVKLMQNLNGIQGKQCSGHGYGQFLNEVIV